MKTLGSYLKEIGATAVNPKINFNANGYPFVSVIIPSEVEGEKPSCENLYFSKNASDSVSSDTDAISIIPKLFVTNTVNSSGESRTKLTFNAPKYVDITSLWE